MFGKKLKKGIEISPSFLSWVEIESGQSQPLVADSCLAKLPEGMIKPSFTKKNLTDPSGLKNVIEKIIPVGKRSGDISLSLPDNIIKISLLNFDELPKKREEIERLILWKLKKTIPLAPEMAKVDYSILKGAGSGIDLIAAIASREVIREYEDLLTSTGLRPKIVDLSSMNLLNVFRENFSETFFFLTVKDYSITISVVYEGQLKLFRNKEVTDDRIIKELITTINYCGANFSGNFNKVYLFSQRDKQNNNLKELLTKSVGNESEVIELNLSSVIGEAEKSLISEKFAAAIGGALRLK